MVPKGLLGSQLGVGGEQKYRDWSDGGRAMLYLRGGEDL